MMLRLPAFGCAVLAIAGCAISASQSVAAQTVTVGQLITKPEQWDGRIVEVSAWLLSSCDDYERTCSLEAERGGQGDAIYFAPTDEDRIILRELIGKKIVVRGSYNGCLGPGETRNDDGSMTLHLCLKHLTDARLVTQTKDSI